MVYSIDSFTYVLYYKGGTNFFGSRERSFFMGNQPRSGLIVLACLFLFFSGSFAVASEPEVFDQEGNIFFKMEGKVTPITTTGRDSQPVLSPDGKWVAFNREIEGKVAECKENDNWECPGDELWIFDIKTQSERMLLEPRLDVPPKRRKDVIYQFNGKKFSLDSQTIYFITPAWEISGAIHAVDVYGNNERYVMHGYNFRVVKEPLSPKIKKYLLNELKEDDWRIFPKEEGYNLVFKALRDDVIGYLAIERSGIETISSTTPLEDGWKGEDGIYYRSMGREFWTELTSPDGRIKIPLDKKIY
jgi:hypothetical protein